MLHQGWGTRSAAPRELIMRHLSLNLLTSSATLLLLVALAVPAVRIVDSPPRRPSRLGDVPQGTPRAFGVYVDPWHVDDWARKVGGTPQLVAKFEAFSRARPIDNYPERGRAPAGSGA